MSKVVLDLHMLSGAVPRVQANEEDLHHIQTAMEHGAVYNFKDNNGELHRIVNMGMVCHISVIRH